MNEMTGTRRQAPQARFRERLLWIALAACIPLHVHVAVARAEQPLVAFRPRAGELKIEVEGRPFATYVFHDARIPRPYFAHVHTRDGIQVTRNHPPKPGVDPADHAELHPGIWLAFGDLSGADFWRNKARVEHVGFRDGPSASDRRGTFSVRNRYVDGRREVCREDCRYTIVDDPAGVFLIADSAFAGDEPFAFGDQEEMGLGLRVASAIRVKGGRGRMLNSDGLVNEKQIWGKAADWCDYSGPIDGRQVGMTVMPDPANFRRSWFHARDYGFVAANPFGRHALTRGETSSVRVEPGKRFRLRFGVWVHSDRDSNRPDVPAAYRRFVDLLAELPRP
jgi:hypothetical protein